METLEWLMSGAYYIVSVIGTLAKLLFWIGVAGLMFKLGGLVDDIRDYYSKYTEEEGLW